MLGLLDAEVSFLSVYVWIDGLLYVASCFANLCFANDGVACLGNLRGGPCGNQGGMAQGTRTGGGHLDPGYE